jgi:hypothetical protein
MEALDMGSPLPTQLLQHRQMLVLQCTQSLTKPQHHYLQ